MLAEYLTVKKHPAAFVLSPRAPDYKGYPEDGMEKAIELVHNGSTVRDAAAKYGISANMLSYRVSKRKYPKAALEKTLEKALELVHNGYTVSYAAKKHLVPARTLLNRVKKCKLHHGKCRGAALQGFLQDEPTVYLDIADQDDGARPRSPPADNLS